MTIQILGYRITIFQVTKLERFTAQIDETARKAQAREIIESSDFAELKARAKAARALRAG